MDGAFLTFKRVSSLTPALLFLARDTAAGEMLRILAISLFLIAITIHPSFRYIPYCITSPN